MSKGMLKNLEYEVGSRLDEGFLKGTSAAAVEDLVRNFKRDVPTEHLRSVLEEAMRRFDFSKEGGQALTTRAATDAWLAPRVHAALRLTRREAAGRGLWRYLAVVVAPAFVRWRWPGDEEGTPMTRFIGPDNKHAIARLWWGGELMRNGHDYSLVPAGFEVQNIADNWLRWDMAHNRAVMQGCLTYLSTYDGGSMVSSKDAVKVGKALNRAATTISLDALAPVVGHDAGAHARWRAADINEQDWFGTKLPTGPDDGAVDPRSVNAVVALLSRLAPPRPPTHETADSEPAGTAA